MIDRRVEVVARLKALEESAAPLVAFLQNPNAVQELKADKQYNLQMLIERYQVCVSKFWIFVFSVSLKFVWRFLIVWWFIEFVVMILMFIWVLGGWGFGLWVKVFCGVIGFVLVFGFGFYNEWYIGETKCERWQWIFVKMTSDWFWGTLHFKPYSLGCNMLNPMVSKVTN